MKSTYLLITLMVVFTSHVSANIIFQEDFESYTAGTVLNGQGGWNKLRGPDIKIGSSGTLPGQFLDGLTSPVGSTSSITEYENIFGGIEANSLVELSYDSFGSLTNPKTHNTFLGFFDGTNRLGWSYNNNPNGNRVGRWSFSVQGSASATGTSESMLITDYSLFDRVINSSVLVNTRTNETYGVLRDGETNAVLYTTSTFDLSIAFVEGVDRLGLYQDYRYSSQGFSGAEYDNIVITSTAVPEPASFSLAIMGLSAVFLMRRRKKNIH